MNEASQDSHLGKKYIGKFMTYFDIEFSNANELTDLVQNMLTQMQERFKGMSDNIVGRIDEMGGRIEELEKSIGELVNEAGTVEDNMPQKWVKKVIPTY